MALGRHGMFVPGADIEYIARHGKATRAFGVIWATVPFECHASIVGDIHFFRDFILLLDSLAKMI